MHVVTVISTRPEIVKMSRIMPALDAAMSRHTIVHTSQNWDYELRDIFFEQMRLRKPDYILETRGNTPIQMTADIMSKLDVLFSELKPDVVVVLGDTNGCLAAALTATRHKIPLAHLEAGNRCFDFRSPEETNRIIIDHLPGIQMPYSERARENLMREGIPTDRVIKTGSPMNEVLTDYAHDIYMSDVLPRLGLKRQEYFVASIHREENITQFGIPYGVLDAIASRYGLRILVSTHPRIAGQVHANLRDGAGDLYDVCGFKPVVSRLVEFCKPFGFFDYCNLQQNAKCTLSDSGTITEESSLLGFPALNLRETHERPEGSEEGNVIMTGMNVERVLESIPLADAPSCTPDDYAPRQVAQKVVRTILSYTDYVNKNVWRKCAR